MPTIDDVRRYWNDHPLFSFEADAPGTPTYFACLEEAKLRDAERFTAAYWNFTGYAGKRVLDVGCGPGWYTVRYAMAGAQTFAIDLTPTAVELAGKYLSLRGATAQVDVGNAEAIPHPDEFFDLVASSGVLHHTPDHEQAFRECFRVLAPGGEAKITLYRKGILHHPLLWRLTTRILRALRVRHPGADLARTATDPDDFIRQYDGQDNPVGTGLSDAQWRRLLEGVGFRVEGIELHFVPVRFFPAWLPMAAPLHRLLERLFGTMAYFRLRKPGPRG